MKVPVNKSELYKDIIIKTQSGGIITTFAPKPRNLVILTMNDMVMLSFNCDYNKNSYKLYKHYETATIILRGKNKGIVLNGTITASALKNNDNEIVGMEINFVTN